MLKLALYWYFGSTSKSHTASLINGQVEPEGEFVHPDQEPLLDEGERQEAAETGLAPSSSTVQQADTWRSNASIVWKRLPLLQVPHAATVALSENIVFSWALARWPYTLRFLDWQRALALQSILCREPQPPPRLNAMSVALDVPGWPAGYQLPQAAHRGCLTQV